MKKSILVSIAVLAILSFAFINSGYSESPSKKNIVVNSKATMHHEVIPQGFLFDFAKGEDIKGTASSDFFFDYGTRFNPMKKTIVDKAKSAIDFLPKEQTAQIVEYKSVDVILIIDDKQSDIIETTKDGILTEAQLKLLQSSNYATHIKIKIDYLEAHEASGFIKTGYSTPHLSIVPEKQAAYIYGKPTLLNYFRTQSKALTENFEQDKLRPARLYFTVTKNGALTHINLPVSSGNKALDEKIMMLLLSTSGEWEPAKDAHGQNVEQELVVFFGAMGC